jgi:multicomponent Na+:H+ antiporter subunit D
MNIYEGLIPLINQSPALLVAVPLLGAFLTPLFSKINDKLRNGFVIFIVTLTMFLAFILAYEVFSNGIQVYVFGGDTQIFTNAEGATYAIRIMFEVDALSAFMAIIAVIISFAAVIYSWAFIKNNTGLDKYYTLLLLMLTGMLGMVLTGDLFNFFVFLEITSIASAALIAFYVNKGTSVLAGFKYIVISAVGALFILFAIGLFYGQYDALNLAIIANNMQFTFLDKVALVLLVSALALKAGIVPLHMWLPDAYGRAPSSVTLILIGTTQASLYGLIRVVFTLYGNQITNIKQVEIFGSQINLTINGLIGILLISLAIATVLIGVLMALKQSDFKRMIGFAAVAEIGYMLLAIGAAITTITINPINQLSEFSAYGEMALKGGIFHIINDALDIGLMFLVAGGVYYATKETSLNKLGGLARRMKYTTIFFLIALIAIAGLPPMNGFASKLMIYESIFIINPILAIIAILCSILLLAIFVKVFHSIFLGPEQNRLKNVKEVPKSMLLSMGFIAFLIIFFGLFPDFIVSNLINPVAEAIIDSGSYISAVIGGG